MKKVLFIYPDVDPYIPDFSGRYNQGVAYISAIFKEEGVQVELLHIKTYDDIDRIGSVLKSIKPDFIAVSTTTNMYPIALDAAREVKKYENIPILFGGIHSTMVPRDVIRENAVDFVCVGEGEGVVKDLIQAQRSNKDYSGIGNLLYKKDNEILENPVRPVVENLDSLPFSDKKIFDISKTEDMKNSAAPFSVSRGCPFHCTYCVNNRIRKLYPNPGKHVRFKSPEFAINELTDYLQQYPDIRYIIFHDDILLLNKKWANSFFPLYVKEIGLPFICNSRIEMLTKENIELLKESGCRRVWVGIESGNEELRKSVLGRNMSDKKIIEAFDLLHQAKLDVQTFNMVGIPGEKLEDMLDTVKLNAKIRPNGMQVTVFYPYPNTDIYDQAHADGLIMNNKTGISYRTESILKHETLEPGDIKFFNLVFKMLVKIYQKFPERWPELDRILTHDNLNRGLLARIIDPSINLLKIIYVKYVRKYYNIKKSNYKL